MTIYNNFEFGKAYTLSDLQNHYNIPTSIHDNVIINYTSALGMGNDALSAQSMTYMDFQGYQLIHAATPIIDQRDEVWSKELKDNIINPNKDLVHKDYQYGIIPCERIDPNIPNKKQENLHNRSLLLLDFDAMGTKTIADIESYLSNYQYFGWTSFNDGMPGKGRRYRLALILSQPIANADVWNYYKPSIVEWMKTGGFVIDSVGSTTFTQLGIGPAINPAIGEITFFRNDGKLIDITTDIPLITTPTAPAKAPKASSTKTPKAQATGVADDEEEAPVEATEGDSATIKALLLQAKDPTFVSKVIARLNMKSWLKCHYMHGTYFDWATKTHVPESNKTGANAFAWAIRFIGGKLSDFQNFMAIHGNSSVPDNRIWNETKSGTSTPNAFFAVFDSSDYNALGISGKQYPITDYIKEREDEEHNKWELVYPTPGTKYIDTNTVPKYRGGKKKVVDYAGLSAGMGSGKTHIMTKYRPGSTLMLVPTLTIVLQAGSHNIAGVDHVLTFDAGAAGLDKGDYGRCTWDEGHNAGLIPYRHGAIASLDKLISQRPKHLLVQSATVDYSAHVMMADLYGATNPVFIKFMQPITSTKYYKRAIIQKGVSRNKAILFEITTAVNAGRKVYVIHDQKQDNKTIADALKAMGINAATIDASIIDSKACPIANDFVSKDFSFGKHGLQVVLSTRLGCEGINIKDADTEVTVIIAGELDPEFVRQTYGRFRNADTVYGVHISNGGTYRKTIVDEYRKKRELEIASRRSDIVGYRADCISRGISMSQQNFMDYFIKRGIEGNVLTELARDGWYFDKVTNEPQEYWFAPMVLRSEIEKIKFYQSLEHQRVYMEVAGFEVDDVCFISPDDITDEIQSALDSGVVSAAASRAANEAKLIDKLDKVIETALEEDDFDDAFCKGIKNEFGNTGTYYKLIEALHILSGMVSISNAEKFDILRKVIIGKIDNEDLRAEVLMGLSSIRDELLSIWPVGTKVKSDDLDMAPSIVLQLQYDRCKANGMTDAEIIILMNRSNSIWHGEKIIIGSTCSVTELNYIPKWLKNNNLLELGKRKQKRDKITREATYEYPVIG